MSKCLPLPKLDTQCLTASDPPPECLFASVDGMRAKEVKNVMMAGTQVSVSFYTIHNTIHNIQIHKHTSTQVQKTQKHTNTNTAGKR